jgi:hypothetical protein
MPGKEAGDFIPCTSDNNKWATIENWAYISPPSIAGVSDWMVSVAMGSLRRVTEITQPCVHTCNGLFICQLYLLPELLEEMDSIEDTPLTLPFASFVSLSQLIIAI